MGPSNELKIPKLPVMVELSVIGESVQTASVFVAAHREGSPQRQRVLDVLESEPTFLPVVTAAGDHRILNKATFLWVSIPLVDGELPVEEETSDATLYDVRRTVVVELQGGEELCGDLLYSPPPEQARVVDYLNRGGRFLRLWSSERVLLVNKERIISVRDEAIASPNS